MTVLWTLQKSTELLIVRDSENELQLKTHSQ